MSSPINPTPGAGENSAEHEFKPFVSETEHPPELGVVPLLMGVVLGIIFGASSLYLALKVGMTVSASIPIAVLSITLFRAFSKMFGLRQASILESNIVQTTGSVGESLAFGIAATMPALLILGYDMELTRIMTVAALGALLGVLLMIPLRYALIIKGHRELKFPEGTACAEVLIAGEKGGTTAKTVFAGFFVGLIFKILTAGCKLWGEAVEKSIAWFKGAYLAIEVSPELLGVGYIIGPRVASTTVAGGILAAFVLTPMIVLFGEGLGAPLFPATKLVSQMNSHDIWRNYILYIGAGAVAAGGLISLVQSLPVIYRTAVSGLASLRASGVATKATKRTEQDIPMPYVLGGIAILVALIWILPTLQMNLIGALFIVVFGFLFVTVSSRLSGEIGNSSNPISGMTVATLLFTSLIFLGLGWTSPTYRVAALMVAGIVCVAAALGGASSQDLKTGHLVGATPKAQQIGLLIGGLTSALVIGFTLIKLNDSSTIYSKKNLPEVKVPNVAELTKTEKVGGPEGEQDSAVYHVLQLTEMPQEGPLAKVPAGKYLVADDGHIAYLVDPGINGILKTRDDGTSVQKYEAPKARLMSLIIDGILTQKLPWAMVLFGASISLVLHLCGVNALVFAVGVYLPLTTTMPIFIGGAIRWMVDRRRMSMSAEEADSSPGVLYSSGLIAGGAISGIVMAILLVKGHLAKAIDLSQILPSLSSSDWFPLASFAVMCGLLWRTARRDENKKTL